MDANYFGGEVMGSGSVCVTPFPNLKVLHELDCHCKWAVTTAHLWPGTESM